jgi:hypothetical protein
MQTFENNRIRVTLTDEQFASFGGGRATILSHAMMVLGNRSEAALLDSENEQPTDDEIIKTALDDIMIEYLADHCRYDITDTIMRYITARIMPEGMKREIESAVAYAQNELRENPNHPALAAARESIVRRIEDEKNYRKSRARCNWQIDIIGDMPDQIGMCRFQEVAA